MSLVKASLISLLLTEAYVGLRAYEVEEWSPSLVHV